MWVGRERGAQHVDLFHAMRKYKRRVTFHAERKLIPCALAVAGVFVQVAERVIQHRVNARLIHGQDSGWTSLDRLFENIDGFPVPPDSNVVKRELEYCVRLA